MKNVRKIKSLILMCAMLACFTSCKASSPAENTGLSENTSEQFTTTTTTATSTEEVTTVPVERDRQYILEYGNPDPVPYAGGEGYTTVENGSYYRFGLYHMYQPEVNFGFSITETDGTLSNTVIYRYPLLEYQREDGSWERLPYIPEDLESTTEQWVPLVVNPGKIFLQSSINDLANEPEIGMYRVILYVCGQTKDGDWVNLKYEFPVEVKVLEDYIVPV